MGSIGTTAAAAASATSSHAKAPKHYYLSLGDSYAQGYQPPNGSWAGGATPGYAVAVAKSAKLVLVNLGCGGATTSSIIHANGCSTYARASVGAPDPYYTGTQEQAALAFIDAHPGLVDLVTVSIGGNDVTACASNANPINCVGTASNAITSNVGQLVTHLDAHLSSAGDNNARIIGTTYPDVILGRQVYPPGATDAGIAGLSVVAFDAIINPALQARYTSVSRGRFVNVTNAPYLAATSGMDTNPFDLATGFSGPTRKLKPYGTVNVSLWEVCSLTFFCSQGDIHPNAKGYKFLSGLITAAVKGS